MRYQGGKARMAKRLSVAMLAGMSGRKVRYVEPFIGGASVLERMTPHFDEVLAADLRPDVVMLWEAAVAGWEPPHRISERAYERLRDAPPSPLRGFAGIAASFAGKWFGGYARGLSANGTPRDYVGEGRRAIIRRARALAPYRDRISWRVCSYEELTPFISDNTLVYSDPPYAETTTYKGMPAFDTELFWKIQEAWAYTCGADVFVSEYSPPRQHGSGQWECVFTLDRHSSTALDNKGHRATEGLYRWNSDRINGETLTTS